MRTEWTRDCPDDATKQERRDMVKSARPTLDVLRKILRTKLEEQEAAAFATSAYDSPSWPYLQADKNGRMALLKDLIDLVDVSDQEE